MVQLLQAMMILLILFHSSLIVLSSWYIYIYIYIFIYLLLLLLLFLYIFSWCSSFSFFFYNALKLVFSCLSKS
jgi:hypothetical protein